MRSFNLDKPHTIKYEWQCACGQFDIDTQCDGYQHPNRTGPVQAYRDALAHATKTLKILRTQQGTDNWGTPEEYTPEMFMAEWFTIIARVIL